MSYLCTIENAPEATRRNNQRKQKRSRNQAELPMEAGRDEPVVLATAVIENAPETTQDRRNPAANVKTIGAQTYQNYKSALKWWHAYECPDMDKIGFPWPAGMDDAVKKAIATYKRDVVAQKRTGIMTQKEGKCP